MGKSNSTQKQPVTLYEVKTLGDGYISTQAGRLYYVGGEEILICQPGHRHWFTFQTDGQNLCVGGSRVWHMNELERVTTRDTWNEMCMLKSRRIVRRFSVGSAKLRNEVQTAAKRGDLELTLPIPNGMTFDDVRTLLYYLKVTQVDPVVQIDLQSFANSNCQFGC